MVKKSIHRVFFSPLKVGGILGGVFGFISDFLQPLAPVGYMIAFTLFIFILITLVLKVIPSANQYFYSTFPHVWYAPLLVTLIVLCSLLSLSNFFSEKYGEKNKGIAATAIPFVGEVQERLISIDERLGRIERQQVVSDSKIDVIREGQNTISGTMHLNIHTLKQAVLSGNLEAVKEFHRLGGDLNVVSDPFPGEMGDGEAIVISLVKNKHKSVIPILAYLENSGAFDINYLFPVNTWGSYLSDHYRFLMVQESRYIGEVYNQANNLCRSDKKSRTGDEFSKCIEDNELNLLKEENLKIYKNLDYRKDPLFPAKIHLKSAANTLINEARNAGNQEVVAYLIGRGANSNKPGVLILASGEKIEVFD